MKRKRRRRPEAKAVEPFDVPSAAAWERWLEENHASSPGVWLTIARKGSGLRTPTYDEALDCALAWGWIDAQKRSLDETAWLQRFCPRRPKGLWSQRNREKVAVLERAGRMRPPGTAAVLAAKQDGRWDAAYASPSRATVPDDLARALAAAPKAAASFARLDAANRYAVLWRVATAKTAETRTARIARLVELLARGERLHPGRRARATRDWRGQEGGVAGRRSAPRSRSPPAATGQPAPRTRTREPSPG